MASAIDTATAERRRRGRPTATRRRSRGRPSRPSPGRARRSAADGRRAGSLAGLAADPADPRGQRFAAGAARRRLSLSRQISGESRSASRSSRCRRRARFSPPRSARVRCSIRRRRRSPAARSGAPDDAPPGRADAYARAAVRREGQDDRRQPRPARAGRQRAGARIAGAGNRRSDHACGRSGSTTGSSTSCPAPEALSGLSRERLAARRRLSRGDARVARRDRLGDPQRPDRAAASCSASPSRSSATSRCSARSCCRPAAARSRRSVRTVRLELLRIFGVALLVTVLLSFYLAGTIVRPIRRLAAAAERARGRRARVEIPDFTRRGDEIGDLSGSLREMTDALWQRMNAIESFAADVAHEIKNPLSSLRSAVETAVRIEDPASQRRLMAIILDDVERLDRLITDISDASRLDAEIEPPRTGADRHWRDAARRSSTSTTRPAFEGSPRLVLELRRARPRARRAWDRDPAVASLSQCHRQCRLVQPAAGRDPPRRAARRPGGSRHRRGSGPRDPRGQADGDLRPLLHRATAPARNSAPIRGSACRFRGRSSSPIAARSGRRTAGTRAVR